MDQEVPLVYRNPQLDHILSQLYPVYILRPYLFKTLRYLDGIYSEYLKGRGHFGGLNVDGGIVLR
jgi:hypothetical protein